MGKRKLSVATDDHWSSSDDLGPDADEAYVPARRSKKNPEKKKRKCLSAPVDGEASDKVAEATPHSVSLHAINSPGPIRTAILTWYRRVHENRGMPWRKQFDPTLGPDERSQRAYEVWVSEIMLQQTQVATVIPYYKRWMAKFPTIRDLAASPIDEVNAVWKGLGYYSRASRLLAGAQKVVKDYDGRLPGNSKDLEANIPGIGRYSAGAISSIAYGERAPVVDGNVTRLLCRFLALHAPPKSKATLDILWAAATAMVRDIAYPPDSQMSDSSTRDPAPDPEYAGDLNQALIELGSTVCTVRDPHCTDCPIRGWCSAYVAATNTKTAQIQMPIEDIEDLCAVCEPLPSNAGVTAYPMKVERKKAREELDVVNVVEWRPEISSTNRQFLLVRRPEEGLLAGLYEYPTSANVSLSISAAQMMAMPQKLLSVLLSSPLAACEVSPTLVKRSGEQSRSAAAYRITKIIPAGDVRHVFSHIKKTYRVQWVLVIGGNSPPELAVVTKPVDRAKSNAKAMSPISGIWLPFQEVPKANVGTGVTKVWKLVKELWKSTN